MNVEVENIKEFEVYEEPCLPCLNVDPMNNLNQKYIICIKHGCKLIKIAFDGINEVEELGRVVNDILSRSRERSISDCTTSTSTQVNPNISIRGTGYHEDPMNLNTSISNAGNNVSTNITVSELLRESQSTMTNPSIKE